MFDGDLVALEKGRLKINEEYKNKKNVTDTTAISEVTKINNINKL